MNFRIGEGWDVHALVPGRKLILGGVEVPHSLGLLGHSDADVLLHAITDALFGAAALGDIGRHFSDTDAQFKGADSAVLLAEAARRVRAKGFEIGNIDSTIVAQAPKLAPHIEKMRERIAQVLELDVEQVNVKAKTAEKLGLWVSSRPWRPVPWPCWCGLLSFVRRNGCGESRSRIAVEGLHFRPGQGRGVIGQRVIVGLLVDIDLLRQCQSLGILKQPGRQKMLIVCQQTVEEVGAAAAAEGALRPWRGGKARDGAAGLHRCAAMQREGGPLSPAPAHAAVADMNFVGIGGGDENGFAQASGLHGELSGRWLKGDADCAMRLRWADSVLPDLIVFPVARQIALDLGALQALLGRCTGCHTHGALQLQMGDQAARR